MTEIDNSEFDCRDYWVDDVAEFCKALDYCFGEFGYEYELGTKMYGLTHVKVQFTEQWIQHQHLSDRFGYAPNDSDGDTAALAETDFPMRQCPREEKRKMLEERGFETDEETMYPNFHDDEGEEWKSK
jgi:hypothetical protein